MWSHSREAFCHVSEAHNNQHEQINLHFSEQLLKHAGMES